MFVKQIDMKKAFELAAKGMEIKVLAPIGQEGGWENLAPDTLQHMLKGVMFFRREPALENEVLSVVPALVVPEPLEEKTLSDLTSELKQKLKQAELAKPVKQAKGKLDVDIGKMKALREAGWSYAKIADEMRISEASVYNYLKEAEEGSNGEIDTSEKQRD